MGIDGSGYRVWGVVCKVVGFRVQGVRLRVEGVGIRA